MVTAYHTIFTRIGRMCVCVFITFNNRNEIQSLDTSNLHPRPSVNIFTTFGEIYFNNGYKILLVYRNIPLTSNYSLPQNHRNIINIWPKYVYSLDAR